MILLGLFLTGFGATTAVIETVTLGSGWRGAAICFAGLLLFAAGCVPNKRKGS